ncbi:MAG TPA: NF038122 family metalloprotease, partial [Pyrinomonadaceae bacterium]|nr:NF038122 family metalloprotease [Pyrinomonadaceae bacterium]
MLRKRSLTLCLLALLFASVGSFAPGARAQQSAAEGEFVAVPEEAYVLFQNESGETICRVANAAERARINRQSGDTHVIYRGAPLRRKIVHGNEVLEANSSADNTGLALLPSAGLTIVLEGTAQLDANPTAKNAFIIAANRWEAIISTPITITLKVDYGTTFFGEEYGDANILGQTGSFIIKSNGNDPSLSTVRQRLIASGQTASELELYNALPSSSVPVEFNGTTVSASSVRVNTALARAIGFNLAAGTDAQIGFNSNFGNGGQFDFNPDDGIASGQTDFDSVVTHEIGHALGFSSANGGANSSPLTVWDLFRFRPSTVSVSTFATAPRAMTKGGTQVFFGNFTSTFATQELSLSTGGPNPPEGDTDDGRQSSHWKADELLSTRPYIGIMDPTLSRSLRRTISENDIRAIDLLGYSVAFNPTRPANDNFASAADLQGASGNFTGTSVFATREAGEPLHAGFQGDKSVWFTWTAPTTGPATFDTVGSNFDTTLSVYRGTTVSFLATDATN